jgi:hypothetical protein
VDDFDEILQRLDSALERTGLRLDELRRKVESLRDPDSAQAAWYARTGRWPCLTLDAIKGAGVDVD